MAQQLIIYEKESGTISQVMLFNQDINLDIDKMGLNERYDTSKIGFLIEEANKYINVKKDRVLEGKIVTMLGAPKRDVFQNETESLFEEVAYRKIPEHVGLITPWNAQCGIANYSKDLVDKLKCRVTIFCEKENEPESNNPKIKVVPCWTNRDKSYKYLVELLKKNSVDIAHVQYNHDLMNAGQLKVFGKELREAGIRSILTLHSTKGGVDIYGQSFDTIIVHSAVSANDILGDNCGKEQIEIIPIGTKESFSDKEKKIACIEKEIDHKRPIISNFGFFLPQKGIKEQIQALSIVKKTFPEILLLVVCAIHKVQNNEVSEKYYKECKYLVDELGLNDNVKFITDYLPYKEIFDYLHCSDVVVLPYINSAAQAASSAGRTILTAHRPVIATDVEIFSDLESVILKIKRRDVKLLAETIIEVLSSEDRQEQILNRINSFIERTSWDNIARLHEKVYKAFGDIKIDIQGQVFSYFSASVVNRNLACALDELGVDVTLQSVNMAENKDYELGDDSRDLLVKKPNNLIQVRHQFPVKFNEFDGRTKIVYLQAETSVPDEWVKEIEKSEIDFVWVYSKHAKDLVRRAGITKPVEVIKCGFDTKLFNPDVIPIDLSHIRDSYLKRTVPINDDTFVFLFCGHAQERKNFKAMFKAYLTEFYNDENVVFVVKSYDGAEVSKIIIDLKKYVSEVLDKHQKDLPKTLYIYEDTDPNILPTYFKAANVMCQCSRAEGFGKPIVEAMGMGIPSIVCLFSGPKDFCNENNSFPVPFKLVRSTYHVQSKEVPSMWADTKIEDLRKVMRYCYENPQEVKRRGNQALIDSENWSTEQTAFDVIDFVRKYNL